jgi:hypothetical protein
MWAEDKGFPHMLTMEPSLTAALAALAEAGGWQPHGDEVLPGISALAWAGIVARLWDQLVLLPVPNATDVQLSARLMTAPHMTDTPEMLRMMYNLRVVGSAPKLPYIRAMCGISELELALDN